MLKECETSPTVHRIVFSGHGKVRLLVASPRFPAVFFY